MTAPALLVIGRSGQLARALMREADAAGLAATCLGRPDIDLAAPESIAAALEATAPAVVVNAAAYTAVDRAEAEPERARAVNAWAPAMIAAWCRERGVALIHVSTDYVFDGTRRTPYGEDDPAAPLGVYGQTKLAGELGVRGALERHVIVRTAWVYSEAGANFLTTMLGLARERALLRVVDDQIGAPTYARDLARGVLDIARLIRAGGAPWGTYHLTNDGAASRYAFAAAILRAAVRAGGPAPGLMAVSSAEHPTPAPRPAYSVLDTRRARQRLGITLPHWRDGLERCLDALAMETA